MGYALFADAERLHLTAAKLLTGKDLPLGQMEWTLQNTFRLARAKLEKQQGKRR